MPSLLPSRPSLERLKRTAKDLLAAARTNDVRALARLRVAFPGITAETASLAQAQTSLAREYDFPSWQRLRNAIETRREAAAARSHRAIARARDAEALAANWLALGAEGD